MSAGGVDSRWAYDPTIGLSEKHLPSSSSSLVANRDEAHRLDCLPDPKLGPISAHQSAGIGDEGIELTAHGKLPRLAPILGKLTGWTGGSIFVSGISLGALALAKGVLGLGFLGALGGTLSGIGIPIGVVCLIGAPVVALLIIGIGRGVISLAGNKEDIQGVDQGIKEIFDSMKGLGNLFNSSGQIPGVVNGNEYVELGTVL